MLPGLKSRATERGGQEGQFAPGLQGLRGLKVEDSHGSQGAALPSFAPGPPKALGSPAKKDEKTILVIYSFNFSRLLKTILTPYGIDEYLLMDSGFGTMLLKPLIYRALNPKKLMRNLSQQ